MGVLFQKVHVRVMGLISTPTALTTQTGLLIQLKGVIQH